MPGPPLLKRGQGSTNNWPLRGSSSAAPMPRSQVGRLDALLGRRSTHLSGVVPRLVPADAGDRPELRKDPGVVRVHGKVPPVEPFDPAVATGGHWEALAVCGNPDTQLTHERT